MSLALGGLFPEWTATQGEPLLAGIAEIHLHDALLLLQDAAGMTAAGTRGLILVYVVPESPWLLISFSGS